MNEISLDEVPPNVSSVPWQKEISFFQMMALFIDALQVKMNEINWTLSPSVAYELIAWAMEWCQANNVFEADRPAWIYVREQILARAKELKGTSDDVMREMRMTGWERRPAPTAGEVLERFDWHLPMLRRLVAKVLLEIADANVTPSGKRLTPGEAVDVIFGAVDWLSKAPYFRYKTPYGWWSAVPWIAFVRAEMMAWRDDLKDKEEIPVPASGGMAFSVGG